MVNQCCATSLARNSVIDLVAFGRMLKITLYSENEESLRSLNVSFSVRLLLIYKLKLIWLSGKGVMSSS